MKLNMLSLAAMMGLAMSAAASLQPARASCHGQRGASRLGGQSAPPSWERTERRKLVKAMGRRQALKHIKAARRVSAQRGY